MQLSSNARKGLAAGLAASTILMTAGLTFIPSAFAAPHGQGCLVSSSGTVYLINNGVRQGITSADVFLSNGFSFANVTPATSEDMALAAGANVNYADGTLVKGPSDPLVYLVTGGQKRGFVSESAFLGLGFSFANVRSAAVNTFADLPTGANIDASAATMAHPVGVFVKDSTGTIWKVTSSGRQGIPDWATWTSYGLPMTIVVPANTYDLALPNAGLLAARVNCSSNPVGPLTVSVNGPAASTLVAGQALANLGNFMFSGSGSVSSLTFERTGVSANSTLSNIYLFNGSTRLTDAASVGSDNKVTFAGLNITSPTTISVESDIASSTTGQTVGIKLDSYTSGGVVNPTSVSGNTFTIASATLATVAMSAATGSGNTDPGNDITVWQGTATVGTRDVLMTRLALRQIGSIVSSDINNFRLYVDGNQVASQQSLDSNGYVTFSGSTSLKSGARTLKVLANVIGGSGRTVQMSLRGAYDISTTDTSYNVGVLATGTFPFGPSAFTVNNGTMTVAKASDSMSSNLTLGASDVALGKFTMTAYGEPIKVETLNVQAVMGTNSTSASTIRNGRILINGTQYGSTTNISTSASTSFTVNYTVVPGTPAVVEVHGDVVDGDSTALANNDTIQIQLNAGSSNGTPQVSLTPINVPTAAVTANVLTVASGSISLAKTSTYPNQTLVTPAPAYKLGSFTLTGNSTEAVNVNTFTLSVTVTDTDSSGDTVSSVTDVYLKYNGVETSHKSTVAASGNTWSPSFTVPVNGSVTIDVYGTLASAINSTDTVAVSLLVSGTTASSGNSVSTNSGSVLAGQTLTVGTGSVAATLDASSPKAAILDDSGTPTSAAFKFTATNDSYTVTDMTVTVSNASAVSTVSLMDGSTVLASKPGATSLTFSGLNIAVPANDSAGKVVSIQLTLSPVGVGAGTSDSAVTTALTAATARNSNGTSGAVTVSSATGNAMYVYKAIPTISRVALSSTAPSLGTMTLGKFTIASNGGQINWDKLIFSVTKTGGTGEFAITSPTLWDDAGNSIAGTGTATTLTATDTSGSISFVATSEEAINGSKTYVLKATVASTALSSGDNINVTLDTGVTSHAAANTYANQASTASSFDWSDVSAASHSTTTSDWLSNYLVKNLPLDTWSFVQP